MVTHKIKWAILSAVILIIVNSIFRYFSDGDFWTAKNIFQIVVTAVLIAAINYKLIK